MKTKHFKRIVREHKDNLQTVLNMYMMNKIYLTTSQVELVIKKRDKKKMKTIKIIDLLNKIANGEDVPVKIIYCKYVYKYNSDDREFYSEVGEKALFEELFSYDSYFLNNEVEIIEEENT